MPDILILQHADWESPGTYGDMLAARGLRGCVVRPDRGERLPDVRDFAAVLAMGGPMSVNDDVDLPWLTAEKRLVEAAISADVPYFGTCLGAQLLAAALGARVYRGPRPEYGMQPVSLTAAAGDDPVFAGLPGHLDVFHWHGESFELPVGAVRLAHGHDYPNQAFRVGRLGYGVQFHLEVSPQLLASWLAVPACLDEARHHLGYDADKQLAKQVEAAEIHLLRLARQVFDRWLTGIEG
jgi:GMP synthase-like glutamine amidotransferase